MVFLSDIGVCPFCNKYINNSYLENHLIKEHGLPSEEIHEYQKQVMDEGYRTAISIITSYSFLQIYGVLPYLMAYIARKKEEEGVNLDITIHALLETVEAMLQSKKVGK